MSYHEIVKTIQIFLSQQGCQFKIFEHEPVRTSEEAARVRSGYSLAQGAKAIIVKFKISDQGKQFAMLVLPGDKKFDDRKVKQCFKTKDLRFATGEEIKTITHGVLPGGIPPLGNLFDLAVIADESLFDNEEIIFNAGDRSISIAMKSSDYRTAVNPIIADIAR